MWDDETQIADNPAVSSGVPLAAYFLDANTTTTRSDYNHGIYRPLRTLSYRALALAFGVRPAPFEAANLFFYAVLTTLVLLMLLAATADLFAAGTATALFVVLPVHVQPVAYASALGDLESAVLELGALFCGVAAARARGRRQLGLGAASLLLAAAAMFAKEMAVTEPLLLVLALWLSGHLRRDASRFVAVIVAAHLALAAGYVVLRSLVLGHVAQLPLTPAVLAEGLRKAPVLLVEYAKLTLMPLGHRAFYLVRVGWSAFALALGVIAVCALAAVRLRRPAFTVGLVGFALALLPVLQLLPITTDLADRFALLPSVGLALAAAALLAGMPAPRRALAGELA
ncbi:MAG: hypothetical protein JWM53_6698, partial [bacterium]|nr:hypothetical protein [bacterium]